MNPLPGNQNITIAIIDDSFAVRYALKIIGAELFRRNNLPAKIYSAADGVEGIGYVLVTVPDVIIVDTTLPRYSGRDLVEYLRSNQKFMRSNIKVIIITDGRDTAEVEQFHYLSKQDHKFIDLLEGYLLQAVRYSLPNRLESDYKIIGGGYLKWLTGLLVGKSTVNELRLEKVARTYFLPFKLIRYLLWSINNSTLNVILVLANLTLPEPVEVNVVQAKEDTQIFNLQVYPLTIISTLIGVFMVVAIILLIGYLT